MTEFLLTPEYRRIRHMRNSVVKDLLIPGASATVWVYPWAQETCCSTIASRMMRVLYFSPRICWPATSGAQLRDFHLAKQLAARYSLTYVGLDREMRGPVGSSCREHLAELHNSTLVRIKRNSGYRYLDLVRGIVGPIPLGILNFTTPPIVDEIERLLNKERFDIVYISGVHLLAYARGIRQLLPDIPLLCDWHNIDSEIQLRYAQTCRSPLHRLYARRTALLLRRAEREMLRLADGHTVCSERERQKLLDELPGPCIEVLKNGIDTEYYATVAAEGGIRHNLLFVGAMDYHANIDGVLFFAKEVWPGLLKRRPDLKFVIVGSKPTSEIVELAKQPSITVTGTVDDVRPHYRNAVMAVIPLRVGSGTRMKVLEAMAAGVPVISTRLGAEGLAVTPGKDILIADSPVEIAYTTAALRQETATWHELRANALRLVQEQYDWSKVGEHLLGIFERQLAAQKHDQARRCHYGIGN